MTREEAIMVLNMVEAHGLADEAKRMAIEALQADAEDYEDYEHATLVDIKAPLRESAEAVHGWRIGKPTEQGKYMVTLDSFGHKHIDLFYYGKPLMPNRKVRGKCWYRSDDEWGDVVYDDTDILAWMPLPEPYREENEE